MDITDKMLLVLKSELTQKYSASKSQHCEINKQVKFESHCLLLLLNRGVVMQ